MVCSLLTFEIRGFSLFFALWLVATLAQVSALCICFEKIRWRNGQHLDLLGQQVRCHSQFPVIFV